MQKKMRWKQVAAVLGGVSLVLGFVGDVDTLQAIVTDPERHWLARFALWILTTEIGGKVLIVAGTTALLWLFFDARLRRIESRFGGQQESPQNKIEDSAKGRDLQSVRPSRHESPKGAPKPLQSQAPITRPPRIKRSEDPRRVYIHEGVPEILQQIASLPSYQADEVFATRFAGKWLRARGKVGDILRDKRSVEPGNGGWKVFLHIEKQMISVRFDAAETPHVTSLAPGMTVEVEGIVEPEFHLMLSLRSSKVLDVQAR